MMKRTAFTMLELIVVIIVAGILASLVIPRMERDIRQEALTNIISALRYTQNLALSDNKTDPRDTNWQKELWQLRFGSYDSGKGWFYTISSDSNHGGNVDKNETAIDMLNGLYLYNLAGDSTIGNDESPNIFLTKKYGVSNITLSGDTKCAGTQHIAFDHLGRPHSSLGIASHTYNTYLKTACIITVEFDDNSLADIVISIAPETGYISIL